jgi:hypothetical protein
VQDRYVGDVGDFAKYALLRALTAKRERRLGIVWCLLENELHNADGRHINYLARNEWSELDPALWRHLAEIVSSGHRSVRKVLRAGIFPSDTISFHRHITPPPLASSGRITRLRHRADWLSKALTVTSCCDLIFFDPDNGFETRSVPKYAAKAGKYIFFDELSRFWERGQSLVVYHHLNRTASVREQTKIVRERLVATFENPPLLRSILFRRGSCRHFWILGQTRHASQLIARINEMLSLGWHDFFEVD